MQLLDYQKFDITSNSIVKSKGVQYKIVHLLGNGYAIGVELNKNGGSNSLISKIVLVNLSEI